MKMCVRTVFTVCAFYGTGIFFYFVPLFRFKFEPLLVPPEVLVLLLVDEELDVDEFDDDDLDLLLPPPPLPPLPGGCGGDIAWWPPARVAAHADGGVHAGSCGRRRVGWISQ